MIDPIGIRRAHPADAATIVDFQLRMARETEDLELDPEVLKRGVVGVFAEAQRGTYWIAEGGGVTLGSLLVTYEWSDWRNGTVWWIQSVYVVPEARGRGVFRLLYATLRHEVEASAEVKGLRLYVERRNNTAQRVYERLGMTKEHYDMFEWLKT